MAAAPGGGGMRVMVVVVVCFLWFVFHGKGIMNANYPHHHVLPIGPPYSMWLSILGIIVHVHVASAKSVKAKVHGESWEGNHFSIIICVFYMEEARIGPLRR
jgi:hypothetical protein